MQEAARNSLRAGRSVRRRPSLNGRSPQSTGHGDRRGSSRGNIARQYRTGVSAGHDTGRASARIGFANGDEAPLTGLPDAIKVGDVTAVSPNGNAWAVRTVPEVQGGFVAQDPNTGRVLAMQGGFDFRLSDFNRATQAQRQPGSTIKPSSTPGARPGMTPGDDGPRQTYCYYQGATSARNASAISAARAAVSTPCAGGSSSRAT